MSADILQIRIGSKGIILKFELDMVKFEESGVYFTHSPALDLTGYGSSPDDADEAMKAVLEDYFQYGLEKGTLFVDLAKHGWDVHKDRPNQKIHQPSIDHYPIPHSPATISKKSVEVFA